MSEARDQQVVCCWDAGLRGGALTRGTTRASPITRHPSAGAAVSGAEAGVAAGGRSVGNARGSFTVSLGSHEVGVCSRPPSLDSPNSWEYAD